MSLATNLRKAARTLIDTFGNTGTHYPYASATKTSNAEGDVAVSSWGTSASIKIVDGDNTKAMLTLMGAGYETVGDDEKITRDDVTLALDDRLTVDSIDYRIVEIRPVRTQDTLVIQVIRVERVTSTTAW